MFTRRYKRLLIVGACGLAVLAGTIGPKPLCWADATSLVAGSTPDGTIVREEDSFSVYQLVGGAKMTLVNADEFHALGYSTDRIAVVAKGALSSVPDIPLDGTLVRERTSFSIFVLDGGRRRWITSRAVFDAAGYNLDEVQVVANGALASIPVGADVAAGSADSPDFEDQSAADAPVPAGGLPPDTVDELRSASAGDAMAVASAGPKFRIFFIFRKNRKNPSNSRLFLYRTELLSGRTVKLGSWRAGSGLSFTGGATDSCAVAEGWLPNGWYDSVAHRNHFDGGLVFGTVWQLEDKRCDGRGQKRTDLFIHSEMTPAGTQACGKSGYRENQCWDGNRDYVSLGCIKLKPSHIKQAAELASRMGGPRTGTHRFANLVRVIG